MKKKLKLAFAELEKEMEVIDRKHLSFFKGGGNSNPNPYDCVFEALHYIDTYFGGTTGQSILENKFTSQYGSSWEDSGLTQSQAYSFSSSNYTTSASNLSTSLWQNELNSGSLIMVAINGTSSGSQNGSTGVNNMTPAVVITSYNATTKEYQYWAPQNEVNGSMAADKFRSDVLPIAVCSGYTGGNNTAPFPVGGNTGY